MNIIILRPEQVTQSANTADDLIAKLDDRQSSHVINVLKAQTGDKIYVGILNGKCGFARIQGISEDLKKPSVKLIFHSNNLKLTPPSAITVVLHLALARPVMLKRMLKVAAELGVKKIYIINCNKSEKSYWQSPLLSDTSIEQTLIEGLEQAKDTVLPRVLMKKLFKPYVEDELGELIGNNPLLIPHPYAHDLTLTEVQNRNALKPSSELHLFIGPEGGFTPFEIDCFKKLNAIVFSAGERIMRCETFLPWILGTFISDLN